MAPFTPSAQRIPVGPGTLYAAPLGTAEPTSVTGAWAPGWIEIGYTDKGNDRTFKPTFKPLEVDEELWPIRQIAETYEGDVSFSMAEITAQNLILALNGGIGTSQLTDVTGTNVDGSVWVEPPQPGEEVRIMLGWDAIAKGGSTGPILGRSIYRQCLQTGTIKSTMQKGANKKLYTVTYSFEKPASANPFRDIFPASVAA